MLTFSEEAEVGQSSGRLGDVRNLRRVDDGEFVLQHLFAKRVLVSREIAHEVELLQSFELSQDSNTLAQVR